MAINRKAVFGRGNVMRRLYDARRPVQAAGRERRLESASIGRGPRIIDGGTLTLLDTDGNASAAPQ